MKKLIIAGITLILIGTIMLLHNLVKQKQCDKLPPNEFFSRDYCVKTLND